MKESVSEAAGQEALTAYRAPGAYPPVCAAGRNPRYAAAMLDNVGGMLSEMTTVSFYFYNCLLSSNCREIADAFHHISLVEMHHLSIFSRLAMELGEDPKLWSRNGRRTSPHSSRFASGNQGNRYTYWTPAYLPYPPLPKEQPGFLSQEGLRRLLAQSMEGEQKAIDKYTGQASWIQDENVCSQLLRIAADEQVHLEILTRLHQGL